MGRFVMVGVLTLAALFAQPAAAETYKCACYGKAVADLETGGTPEIECIETFENYGGSVSVQEAHLRVYVDSGNVVGNDKDASIRFRPRDGKCLLSVYGGDRKTALFTGSYCNNDAYKDIGQLKITETEAKATVADRNGDPVEASLWRAPYRVETSGKSYGGFAQWYLAADKKRYMQAICIEDK